MYAVRILHFLFAFASRIFAFLRALTQRWPMPVTGERLSPWVAVGCFTMGVSIIFF